MLEFAGLACLCMVLIRKAEASDRDLIEAMLLAAADWRPGTEPRSVAAVMADPVLARYAEGWAVSVKFTPGPGAGPANVAGSGSATVSLNVGQQQLKVYVSFVYLFGPLMEIEVDAENLGSPVPAAVLQAAVKAVADRAAGNS